MQDMRGTAANARRSAGALSWPTRPAWRRDEPAGGKSAERNLLSDEAVDANSKALEKHPKVFSAFYVNHKLFFTIVF